VSINNGLAIIPNVNLIANIGFDSNATHTIDNFNALANRPNATIGPLIHPLIVVPDIQADNYTMRKYLNPSKLKKSGQLIRRKLRI
jgi:hypothetical protein